MQEIKCPVCGSKMNTSFNHFNNTSIISCSECWCHVHGGLDTKRAISKLNQSAKEVGK